MTHMLCRNRVREFDTWKAVFSSHADAHREATLRLVRAWRGVENPNDVFFLFEIGSIEKARAFIDDPKAAEVGRESGVIEGEYHFIEDAEVY